jgi:hypothetical protein
MCLSSIHQIVTKDEKFHPLLQDGILCIEISPEAFFGRGERQKLRNLVRIKGDENQFPGYLQPRNTTSKLQERPITPTV